MERFALLYSDGSMAVLGLDETLASAREQAEFSDIGEADPAQVAKVARVVVTIVEIVDTAVEA